MQNITNDCAWRLLSHAHMQQGLPTRALQHSTAQHTGSCSGGAWVSKLRTCDEVRPTNFERAGLGLYPWQQIANISEEPVSPAWCTVLPLKQAYSSLQHCWSALGDSDTILHPFIHILKAHMAWDGVKLVQGTIPSARNHTTISAISVSPWILQWDEWASASLLVHGYQHRIHVTPANFLKLPHVRTLRHHRSHKRITALLNRC